MKLFIIGHKGRLGKLLMQHLPGAIGLDVDIRFRDKIIVGFSDSDLNEDFIVLNLASKTDVDWCEENSKDAFAVNAKGVSNVLDAIRFVDLHSGAKGKLIQFSTCHVFGGMAYYAYREWHRPAPKNMYGMTKFMGESVLGVNQDISSVVFRLGNVWGQKEINEALEMEEPVPSFIKRNYMTEEAFVEAIRKLVDIVSTQGTEVFPLKNYYRVLHIGEPYANWDMHRFINTRREEHGLELLPKRNRESSEDGLAPRPHRVSLNVNKMMSLLS